MNSVAARAIFCRPTAKLARKKRHHRLSRISRFIHCRTIPARYQYGTIELSTDQLQHWAGGTTSPEAAQQIIGQGGIANRGLVEGGRFAKVRMEHVWVQAYVNWAPSRGAKQGGYNLTPKQHVNPNGPLNAWVPLA
jgi:hypothetical protein